MFRHPACWTAAVILGLIACSSPQPGGQSQSTSGTTDGGSVSGDQDASVVTSGGEDAGNPIIPTNRCKPRTCSEAGASCGPAGDGCGGTLSCGSCGSGEACGGGGTPSKCGSGETCLPRTCLSAGANCGPVADGCGGTLQCGSCIAPSVCGGDTASICSGTALAPCDNLCKAQVSCPSGEVTTITGTVHAPTPSTYGSADPLSGATVYIPNGTVEPFGTKVSCEQCSSVASGDPIVTATTGSDGTYKLSNVPVGKNIPLVIQLGRWRRQITIPTVAACTNTALTDDQDRMPRNSTEGDIPKMAMATGSADPMECILRKIGIDDSEFTAPGGGGRVDMYYGNGARLSNSQVAESTLTSSLSTLEGYDMVIFACWGMPVDQASADLSNVVSYANEGGRVFATHYSYVWLYTNNPFDTTATWDPSTMSGGGFGGGGGGGGNATVTADVDQSFTRGTQFAEWLDRVGASTTLGQIDLDQVKHDIDAVNAAKAQRWIYDSTQPIHYTFNTPVGASAGAQCGRVLFSDFHAANSSSMGGGGLGGGETFPSECDSNPMTPQEKVLEFMLFDLTSCVAPPGK